MVVLSHRNRSQFLDALASHVDPEHIHFNKRYISINSELDTKVQKFHFADGTTAEADIVLVANGIKSSVRDTLMANGADLGLNASNNAFKGTAFSNTVCYRGLVRRDNATALDVDTSMWTRPMLLISRDKVRRHTLVYPAEYP